MATRYDVITPREKKDGGTYWHKIGAAFSRDQGGFSIVLDSLPIADKEGRVMMLMSEPKPREGGYDQRQQGNGGGYSQGERGRPSDDLDGDEIPF